MKVKSIIFNVDANIQENYSLVCILATGTLSSLFGTTWVCDFRVCEFTFLTVYFMHSKYK